MAWKKKNKDLDEEYEDEDAEYEDEYDDDYDDYDDDYDDYEEEKRRNPLKGVVVVLVILALLLAAACALLYLRMQTAESKVEKLTTALNNAQAEISRMQAEAEAAPVAPVATPDPAAVTEATPEPSGTEATPAPEVTPEPEATPVPTPEVTPEPTPEPTPTPGAQPKDVTDEMLAGVYRPADECWLDAAKTAWANSFMVAAHWGPGLDWTENLVLYQNDQVDVLAVYQNWSLIRTQNDKYGWVVSALVTETAPAGVATPAPADTTEQPEG